MPHPQLDRALLHMKPLSERHNKVDITTSHVAPSAVPRALVPGGDAIVAETAARMRRARELGKPRMLTFGAHSIKNGLGPVLINLMETGWVTHLATNGAGIIHDWEFAFQGKSSEDVRDNVARGQFGIWDETGFYINLAIIAGSWDGLGYGESVGRFVAEEGLAIPDPAALREEVIRLLPSDPAKTGAGCCFLQALKTAGLKPGFHSVPHPYKAYGVQAAAWRMGIPLTGHPMIGHDIIYCHPMNDCAAIGCAAQQDFLSFAHAVSQLSDGVYMSVGSAVMSPMVFEKSMSMSRNIALAKGEDIAGHFMTIVDLQPSHWDWSQGEPPDDNPDYYLRYCKSFSRMGGEMRYLCADNRDFLLTLLRELEK